MSNNTKKRLRRKGRVTIKQPEWLANAVADELAGPADEDSVYCCPRCGWTNITGRYTGTFDFPLECNVEITKANGGDVVDVYAAQHQLYQAGGMLYVCRNCGFEAERRFKLHHDTAERLQRSTYGIIVSHVHAMQRDGLSEQAIATIRRAAAEAAEAEQQQKEEEAAACASS